MLKKRNKNPQDPKVDIIVVSDDQSVAELNQLCADEIFPNTIEKAKDDASKQLPSSTTKSSVHFRFLTSRFNRLVLDYKSKSNINQQKYQANKDLVQFKKLKKRLLEKLAEVKNELRLKSRAFDQKKPNKQVIKSYLWAFGGILVLSGSEALFASSALQIFVETKFMALLLGITMAVCLYYTAVIGCKLLRKAKNRWQIIGIISAILVVVSIVFFLLGCFRQMYLIQMNGDCESCYSLSPEKFMIIQDFFFTCALLLKFFFLPTKEQFKSYSEWKEAKKAISKLSNKKKHLEQSINNMEAELNKTLITRRSLISRAADVELKIQALYEDAFSHYVNTNMHHRKSEEDIPVCFEDPKHLPKLTLYFQDPELLEFNESELEDDV